MRYKNILKLTTLFLSITAGYLAFIESRKQIPSETLVDKITISLSKYLQEVNEALDEQVKQIKVKGELSISEFPVILLRGDSLSQWTDNHLIPPVKAITENFVMKVIKISSGEVLAIKKGIEGNAFIVALIPLHIQYKIINNNLPIFWNGKIFDRHEGLILESGSEEGHPIIINGQTLFKIVLSSGHHNSDGWDYLVILSFCLTIGCVLALFKDWFLAYSVANPGIGFISLVSFLVGVRVAMLLFDFPSQFLDWELFNPRIFASSEVNPSLGDLMLNTIVVFILCTYLLFRSKYFKIPEAVSKLNIVTLLFPVFYALAILFGFLYLYVVIQTIYNNSSLSFSLFDTLSFDILRVIAFLIVVLSGTSIFMFVHVFIRLLVVNSNWLRIYISLILGVGIFIAINTLTNQVFIPSLLVCLIYLGLVFGFKLHGSLSRIQFISFAYLFTCVILLSLNGVLAIDSLEVKRSIKDQFSFADDILSQRDYFGEYLLQESATKVIQDAFIQTRIASPFLSKEPVKQKIKQVLLSGYFSKYSVKVLFFNSSGEPVGSDDKTTFYDWIKTYDNESYKTDYKNVFYVANENTDYAPKYLTFIPISKNNSPLGFIVIELSLKRVIPESVYPELLVDSRFQRGYDPNLSYALITGKEIKYSTGSFNYQMGVEQILSASSLYTSGFSLDGYQHVGVKDQFGRVIVVSQPVKSKMGLVANFSFLLLLGLLIISIVLLGYWFFVVSKSNQLNLATRIQLILNLAFFIPLVSVSVVTLGLTTRSVQMQLEDEYVKKARQLSPTLADALLNSNQPEGVDFEANFTSIVNQLNVDVNIFSLDGKLITSSQPLIFDNQLLSPYINPDALHSIQDGENLFIRNEHVGNLKFSVAYSTLVSPVTGEQLGVVAVPFFQSVISLEKVQITVLGNILSIFTLIFIILVFVSFLVSKWLTSPLLFITNTLGRISLTRENKPLQWDANDEVGMMVTQYNSMLAKLEESKIELERIQREQAWREIAQQVAHEIKNPLTPMKLTLQQLERSLDNTSGTNDTDRLKKSVASLLSNLNSLNDIASSFSSFAKMPIPVMAEVDLLQVLNKSIASFNDDLSITLESEIERAVLITDEKILSRVFVNLLLNSSQAARPGQSVQVTIRMESLSEFYRITFSDNGVGIEDGLKEKIFLPHFTTKKSGSGLGLAIVKESITQLGGNIYFETSAEGTKFYIELKK